MLALLVNGQDKHGAPGAIDPTDRGLNYGDGLFETMLLKNGSVQSIDAHLQRLAHGCNRLGIECPHEATLRAEISLVGAKAHNGIIKLMVTRGSGARGYRSQSGATPTRIVSLYPPPPPSGETLRLRWCETRLSRNPALAGIKHLNRLEQVLAQNEWDGSEIGEGLMLDIEGELVCATAANVFLVRGGELVTSDLRYCGIRGVMRGTVMRIARSLGITVHEEPLWPEDIDAATEMFVTNAVRGIRAVTALGDHSWEIGVMTHALQKAVENDA